MDLVYPDHNFLAVGAVMMIGFIVCLEFIRRTSEGTVSNRQPKPQDRTYTTSYHVTEPKTSAYTKISDNRENTLAELLVGTLNKKLEESNAQRSNEIQEIKDSFAGLMKNMTSIIQAKDTPPHHENNSSKRSDGDPRLDDQTHDMSRIITVQEETAARCKRVEDLVSQTLKLHKEETEHIKQRVSNLEKTSGSGRVEVDLPKKVVKKSKKQNTNLECSSELKKPINRRNVKKDDMETCDAGHYEKRSSTTKAPVQSTCDKDTQAGADSEELQSLERKVRRLMNQASCDKIEYDKQCQYDREYIEDLKERLKTSEQGKVSLQRLHDEIISDKDEIQSHLNEAIQQLQNLRAEHEAENSAHVKQIKKMKYQLTELHEEKKIDRETIRKHVSQIQIMKAEKEASKNIIHGLEMKNDNLSNELVMQTESSSKEKESSLALRMIKAKKQHLKVVRKVLSTRENILVQRHKTEEARLQAEVKKWYIKNRALQKGIKNLKMHHVRTCKDRQRLKYWVIDLEAQVKMFKLASRRTRAQRTQKTHQCHQENRKDSNPWVPTHDRLSEEDKAKICSGGWETDHPTETGWSQQTPPTGQDPLEDFSQVHENERGTDRGPESSSAGPQSEQTPGIDAALKFNTKKNSPAQENEQAQNHAHDQGETNPGCANESQADGGSVDYTESHNTGHGQEQQQVVDEAAEGLSREANAPPKTHKPTAESSSGTGTASSSENTASPGETSGTQPSGTPKAEERSKKDDELPKPASTSTDHAPADTLTPARDTAKSGEPSIREKNRPATERMLHLIEVGGEGSWREILEIPSQVALTEGLITKAYRKGGLKHHPDKVPGDKDGANERFVCIEKAKDGLIDLLLGDAEVKRREEAERQRYEEEEKQKRQKEMKKSGYGLKGSRWSTSR